MRKAAVYVLLLIVFSSCAKHKAELKDEVVYTNFEPDIGLNSVRGTTIIQSGDESGPASLPLDTSCSTKIIVDPSINVSFIFTAKQVYTPWIGGSSLSGKYSQQLFLSSENPLDSFAVLSSRNDHSYYASCSCFKYFQSGDIIAEGLFYSPQLTTAWFRRTDNAFQCPEFSGDLYVAFKRTFNNTVNFGWIRIEKISINGIKIKEAALNKTPDKKIACGQKN